jgi:hypothetical protein
MAVNMQEYTDNHTHCEEEKEVTPGLHAHYIIMLTPELAGPPITCTSYKPELNCWSILSLENRPNLAVALLLNYDHSIFNPELCH